MVDLIIKMLRSDLSDCLLFRKWLIMKRKLKKIVYKGDECKIVVDQVGKPLNGGPQSASRASDVVIALRY
jgi:hypothetical protein